MRKTWLKPYPFPYGLRNPYINPENSQDYAQKLQRNSTFMNSASGVSMAEYVFTEYEGARA